MSDSSNRTRYCANCLTTFLGNPEICGNNECNTNRPGTHWGKLLEPGERIDGRFRIDRRLRIAASGPTYLCQETDEAEQAIGSLLVLQVISPEAVEQDEYFQRLKNEIRILNDLEHPNLVRAHPYLPPETGPPFIVMDYETGGTLMDQLREAGAMSLAHIAQLGLQICDGMRAAHRENLFHGDLHPNRVLLDHIPEAGEPPLVRITDFGAIKTQGGMNQGLDPDGYSTHYAAPERIEGGPPSPESDIYSIGSLLLFALTLQPMVANADRMSPMALTLYLNKKLPPRWSPPPSLNIDASQLAFFNAVLNATMSADPAHRSTIEEVREYLEALLEVEEEETFSTPEFEEAPAEEDLNAADAMAHFNAFSHDPEEDEDEDEKKEDQEAPQTTPEKPDEKNNPTEEELEEEPSTRVSMDWMKMDWMKILWKAGQVSSGIVAVLMILFVWTWNTKPHILPPAWLEAQGPVPQNLMAGDPKTLPDYTSIVESINAKKGRLRKCKLKQDTLNVMVVVEPNGSIRAAGSSYLPKNQRLCVRRKLLGMVLKRRSRIKPVRVRTTLLF